MNIWSPLAIGLTLGAAGTLTGAAILVYRKLHRKVDPAELERLRRLSLARTGRITAGEITGLVEPQGGEPAQLLLIYRYDIAGVTYEVSQDISTMPQVAAQAVQLAGKAISVKFEMKHPSNSIVISEEWSGISGITLFESKSDGILPTYPEPAQKS